MFGQYAGFIIPAYTVSGLVIAALVFWTIATHRSRRAEISELEKRGIKRRAQNG